MFASHKNKILLFKSSKESSCSVTSNRATFFPVSSYYSLLFRYLSIFTALVPLPGLKEVYTKSEYDRPKEVNIEWQKKNPVYSNRTWAVRNFLVKLREKVAKKDYAKMM